MIDEIICLSAEVDAQPSLLNATLLFTRRCYPWDFAFKKSASLGANWTLQATLNWIIYHGAKRNLPWIWSENGSLKAAINQGFFFLSDISIASPLYFPKPNQFKLGIQSHICCKKFMNAWTNVEKFHCTHPKNNQHSLTKEFLQPFEMPAQPFVFTPTSRVTICSVHIHIQQPFYLIFERANLASKWLIAKKNTEFNLEVGCPYVSFTNLGSTERQLARS